MYLVYSLLLTLGVITLLPWFAYDALRHGKYVAGLRERLGGLGKPGAGDRPVIWLHCVSVGEAQAARPVARALMEEFPSHSLVVSTTTLTGQRVAREVFGADAAAVFYFPFDWAWSVRRALRAISPAAVLIMETELWPNFLRECRRRRIPTAIINGRLSERSFRRYHWVRRFARRIVNDLDLAVMQAEADAERIKALGLTEERVHISGNVKFDAGVDSGSRALADALRERFRLCDGRPLIVAASTHSPEERIFLESFSRLRADPRGKDARLLIAPRHPERFAEASSLLESSGLKWVRRSASPSALDADCDAILLDTVGELRAAYPLATIVFVGGSIAPTGGHNVIEPAAAGACSVTGAHTFNFVAVIEDFRRAGALIQLPDLSESEAPGALADVLLDLLSNDDRRQSIGEKARAVVEQNRGATAVTVGLLAPLLSTDYGRTGRAEVGDASRGALTS